jgi:KUP system potassium uptake protein
VLGLFGASLFYGDGVITPAMSVLSAMEGIEVATPSFKPVVVPITLIVLICLYAVQRKGTAGIGKMFGPVMLLWFSVLALMGLYNIIRVPGILAAFNPLYAVNFVIDHHWGHFLRSVLSYWRLPVPKLCMRIWGILVLNRFVLPGFLLCFPHWH